MLILAVVTDFKNREELASFIGYRDDIISDRRKIIKMIALMRSNKVLAQVISAYSELAWCKELYGIADDIFQDWDITPDNLLVFSPEG